MYKKDLHMHTVFSDGKNTPEEMIEAALSAGLETVGISDHSYMPFFEDWCMKPEQEERYLAEISRLKEKYRGKIEVLCGVEKDYFSEMDTSRYDYVIGSVHYFEFAGELISVDESAAVQEEACRKYCGGDYYALAENYFKTVADVANKLHPDIIGHFDLVCKFCEKAPTFDQSHPRYRAAWQAAADKLILSKIPFEINTGAMTRGYRTSPYPSKEMRAYIAARGGRFVLSSDSHSTDALRESTTLPIWREYE